MGDLMGLLKAEGKEIAESPVSAEHLGELVELIAAGELSGKLAKEIFPKMFATGDAPAVIIEREGLKQISDTGALEKIIDGRDRRQSEAGGAVPGGKTTVIEFPGGPGDEGHARPGQRGGGERNSSNRNWGEDMLKEGDKAPDIQVRTDTGEEFRPVAS